MKSRMIALPLLLLLAARLPAADSQDEPQYTLRYKFSPGEVVRWKVVHLATNETTIRGNTQTSKSRSASTKVWRITDVDDQGNVTISHTVESVDMWQQLSDRPEIRYNSETDETVPPEYEHVAKTVGVPITTVTIDAAGNILERQSEVPQANFGLGDIVMLLPPKPVKVGGRWHEPSEIQVRQPDKRIKRIKIRKLYTLEKVLTGVATISVKTEVLTPIDDNRVKAQLVQQLTEGTIKFDLDAGRVMSKQIDWDESLVGFDGAESRMKYLARFTEDLIDPDQPEPKASTARSQPSDDPVSRRR